MKNTFFIASLAITSLTTGVFANETKQFTIETKTNVQDEIVKSTAKDSHGKTIKMSFNNTKDIVIVLFEGKTIEMKDQKPASGIWYSNDHYELRGKGSEVILYKGKKIVFKGK
ncbi:MliC family protein [Elizabethkingia anophelis]|nr:MliC family protein [Elizabethkingia anophelis]